MRAPTFHIEGVIGEDDATATALAAFLRQDAGPAVVVINSPGGSAFTGAAMLAEIERHGRVTTVGQGIVASAATLPLIGGREIELHSDVAFMIHEPSAMTFGRAEDHRATAAALDKLGDTYAAAYARATGHPVGRIRAWMADETWLTAEEALALNFCDRIETHPDTAPIALALGGIELTQFRNPPAALVQLAHGRAAVPPVSSKKEAAHGP